MTTTQEALRSGAVGLLFTDMSRSTEIARGIGAARFQQFKASHDEVLTVAIACAGGRIEQYTGDGYLALFAHPADALRAAIRIQEDLKREPITAPSESGAETYTCLTRIGVHCIPRADGGQVPSAQDLPYDEIAYAHRVMEPGCDGQILVSEAVRAALPSGDYAGSRWQVWPDRLLKGFTEAPQSLYELLWEGVTKGEPGSRWLPAWYGRELNSYIERAEPAEAVRSWMIDSTPGKVDALRRAPLLTIHGFGGLGKTRLAVETVIRSCALFPAGTAYIQLDRLSHINPEVVTPGRLCEAAAEALELEPAEVSDERSLVEALTKRCRKGNVLLVLDNWESVKNPATVDWLKEILVVPQVFCLITSRDLVGIDNVGRTYELPFMPVPTSADEPIEEYESAKLFIERAGQHQSGWAPSSAAQRERLVAILKALNGHPLGIELVAAQVFDNPALDEIVQGLSGSLLAVQATRQGERRWSHARHESLQATLDWSVDRLPAESRDRFLALGVIPFDFSAACAHDVAGTNSELLKQLRRKSLLILASQDEGNRYDMLPVVREYCMERLGVHADEFRNRYVQWCLRVAGSKGSTDLDTTLAVSREWAHLLAVVTRVTRVSDPRVTVSMIGELGNALVDLPLGSRDRNARAAIACFEAVLRLYTQQDYPKQWAATQINLGNAYAALPTGNRGENLRRSNGCYEAALLIFNERDTPEDWAMTQDNLGVGYFDLPSGNRTKNLRKAIACHNAALRVRTKEEFPGDWASTQVNLGNAYCQLPTGSHEANLRKGISHFEAALGVYGKNSFPYAWASAHNSLGSAFVDVPSGNRSEDLRAAIKCFETALQIFTQVAFPLEWAGVQSNLGVAYARLLDGDWPNNLRYALECYESARSVYIEQAFPFQRGHSHLHTGCAWVALQDLVAAREHFTRADASYAAAGLPAEWEWRAYALQLIAEIDSSELPFGPVPTPP